MWDCISRVRINGQSDKEHYILRTCVCHYLCKWVRVFVFISCVPRNISRLLNKIHVHVCLWFMFEYRKKGSIASNNNNKNEVLVIKSLTKVRRRRLLLVLCIIEEDSSHTKMIFWQKKSHISFIFCLLNMHLWVKKHLNIINLYETCPIFLWFHYDSTPFCTIFTSFSENKVGKNLSYIKYWVTSRKVNAAYCFYDTH